MQHIGESVKSGRTSLELSVTTDRLIVRDNCFLKSVSTLRYGASVDWYCF